MIHTTSQYFTVFVILRPSMTRANHHDNLLSDNVVVWPIQQLFLNLVIARCLQSSRFFYSFPPGGFTP